MHRSALRTFRQMDFSTLERFDMGYFRHREFSALGIFGTWTFWHIDILAPCKAIWTFRHLCYYAKMSMCRNVHVPKCPLAEMFLCRKVLMPKSPNVEMFPCWNVHLPESLQRRMVHVPKCSRDETSVLKWLLPKSQVLKWWEAVLWCATNLDTLIYIQGVIEIRYNRYKLIM